MSDSVKNEDEPSVAVTPPASSETSPSSPTSEPVRFDHDPTAELAGVGAEPDAGSVVRQFEAGTLIPVPSSSDPTAARSRLRLEVLRLAQQAGAKDDPGHPATPDEVVERATTYLEWMQK